MLGTILLLGTTFQQAAATHYYNGFKWSGTGADSCYDSFSLNDINIDGGTGKYSSVVKGVLDSARNDWNNEPSQFNLGLTSGFLCHNWIQAAALGSTGPTGQTWLTCGSSLCNTAGTTITDADVEFNVSYAWSTTKQCNPQPYTLLYTATHEYGHWVSFGHSPSGETSIMRPVYDCNLNTVYAHDSSSLTSIYG